MIKLGIVGQLGPDLYGGGDAENSLSWVGHGDRSGPYLGGANPDGMGTAAGFLQPWRCLYLLPAGLSLAILLILILI